MKQNLHQGFYILSTLILCTMACKKSADTPADINTPVVTRHDSTQAADAVVPYPANPVPECGFAPNYGDSIAYAQPPGSSDFYIYPINNQGVQGTYLSWPAGLVMNPKTGSINMTQSETGARYSVAFVKDGTTDTCMSQMIMAGAAYMDSVYVMSQGDITSRPYFNANPFGPSPCPASGPGNSCQFDYNGYAKGQGIAIDTKTGYIDLQKTMKQSLFGILPINGTTVFTTIYYKLSDNSNMAPQKIQLQMVYYNRKSDIPAGLLAGVTSNILNTLGNLLLSKGPSPRPPLIIIVRNN